MRILLNFGDNDFYYTMKPFGETILRATSRQYTDPKRPLNLTKERIKELWDMSCKFFYLIFQNRWEYQETEAEVNHTEQWLQGLKIERIYINEEIDKLLADRPDHWFNSEALYVDTDNQQMDIW